MNHDTAVASSALVVGKDDTNGGLASLLLVLLGVLVPDRRVLRLVDGILQEHRTLAIAEGLAPGDDLSVVGCRAVEEAMREAAGCVCESGSLGLGLGSGGVDRILLDAVTLLGAAGDGLSR